MGRHKIGGGCKHRMSEREYKFADLVLRGTNPIEAATAAGYNWKTPRVAVHRLMTENQLVKNYIETERIRIAEQRRIETEVDDIWITKKFKEILDRCMQAQPVMRYDHEAGELRQAVDEETGQLLFKFDAIAAIKAAENLAKHIGYYEIDNNQKRPVIKIGAVQNIANYFFADEPKQENHIIEAGPQPD